MAEWAEKKKDVTPTPVRIRGHDSLVWSCFTVQIFLCHSVKVFLGCTQTKAGAQPMVDALVWGGAQICGVCTFQRRRARPGGLVLEEGPELGLSLHPLPRLGLHEPLPCGEGRGPTEGGWRLSDPIKGQTEKSGPLLDVNIARKAQVCSHLLLKHAVDRHDRALGLVICHIFATIQPESLANCPSKVISVLIYANLLAKDGRNCTVGWHP
jgi:hypothetical protein